MSEEETVKFLANQVKSLPIPFTEKVETLKKLLKDYEIEWKEEYIELLRY
jgi:hypothetical protein